VHANPHAKVLLLVHGFLSSAYAWEAVAAALVVHYRIVVVDLPGFGESEKPDADRYRYDYDAFAETLLDISAALGLSRVCVIGHDIGGSAALTLAARHPSVVSHLVLVSPIVYHASFGPWVDVARMPIIGSIAFKQLYGRGAFMGMVDAYAAHAEHHQVALDRAFSHFTTPRGREAAYATLLGMQDTRALVAMLPRVLVESLVIWGQDDRVVAAPQGRRLARELTRARLLMVDAGHAPHEEAPASVVEAVRSLLDIAPPPNKPNVGRQQRGRST
jgi:pimeloyl-ACP methyl ester carboxylesterase